MDMDMDMDMNMTMTMAMTFEFSKSATVLFKFWKFSTIGGLIGSMVGIFILAFAYEALKFYRGYLKDRAISIRQGNKGAGDARFTQVSIMSKSHLIQTLLQAVQVIVSYFLMLIFMTYNAWLALAVVFGLVAGYFVFGWNSATNNVNDDHCS
ncbi:high affinity copper uptake protein 1-like isoform X2 [Sitophilus oryzae]|uniref:Copper transport protein n=1 Tax=Sitophilus oryzae TaxID=7048 RepID=A0A6J2XRL2_SITOR|nr:high affinity copper uptake protein 1-like isoform X2 [Sitophilus oryzae]